MLNRVKQKITQDSEREQWLTSHDAAALLQVNPSSINNWVRDGKIHAFRTPGGHRRITARALAKFIGASGMPLPESLQPFAAPCIIWVEGNAKRRSSIVEKASANTTAIDIKVASSVASGLIALGGCIPDVFVLDARVDDLSREDTVVAAREAFPTLVIAFIDGSLTDEEQAQARRLNVQVCANRSSAIEAIFDDILDALR